MRKVYAQVIQKEVFKHVHSRSETGMHMSVEQHSSLQQNIDHLHTVFKIVQGNNKGFGTELL